MNTSKSKPVARFFTYDHFAEAIVYSAHKIIVKQTPEWRMFGVHPHFGRFIAKWVDAPGGAVVCATQF